MEKREVLEILASAQGDYVRKTAQKLPVPFLQNESLPVSFFADEVDLDAAADALVNFSRTPSSLRMVIQRLLFQAAQQSFEDCKYDFASPQEQLTFEAESTGSFPEARVPNQPESIWSLVKFTEIHVGSAGSGGAWNPSITVSGNCAWDGEHGVEAKFDKDGELLAGAGD